MTDELHKAASVLPTSPSTLTFSPSCRVERFFNRIKQCRGGTGYDKLVATSRSSN